LTGRSAMKSPGAPSHQRETSAKFWRVIAAGVTSEAAAERVGVAPAVGCRWFRHGGGMATDQSRRTVRSLPQIRGARRSRHAARSALGVREIARRLSRSPSTIFARVGAAMPRRDAASWSTELRLRSGRPSWSRNDQRPRSWSPIHSFAATCRIGWQEALAAEIGTPVAGPREAPWRGRKSHTVAMSWARAWAPSRYLSACRSTFPHDDRCGLAMRRSSQAPLRT